MSRRPLSPIERMIDTATGFNQFMDACHELERKDAARYRWLRSRDLETVYEGGVFVGKTPDNTVLNFEDCDRAVDAAMMAEKDAGE